ncbi:MAG: hypothetical protein HPY67_03900 [Syntrophaceae bacterium]|nr:hypothetical protein [Syntrophaceae bacterium]
MNGLVFDAERHAYLLDGRVVPSVTQILAAEGIIDGQWYTEEGRRRGDHVHLALRYHDEGRLDEESVTDEVRPYLEAWQRFISETGFICLQIEQPFADRNLGFAGTPDRVGWMDGDKTLSIIDIKTGAPEPWHALQTAAYAVGLGKRTVMRWSVYLKPNGAYRLIRHQAIEDVIAWLGLVSVHNWKLKYMGSKS